jgi:hypothetical protein
MLSQSAALQGQNHADERESGAGSNRRARGSRLHTLAINRTRLEALSVSRPLRAESHDTAGGKLASIFSGCDGVAVIPPRSEGRGFSRGN